MIEEFKAVVKRGNFVVLDTETTGLGPTAELCQIGIIDAQGNTLLDALVKPTVSIPAEASAVHGITDETVKDCPGFELYYPVLQKILAGKDVIIYNKGYDVPILNQSAKAAEIVPVWECTFHCAMLPYAEHYGDWNSYRNSFRWQKLSDAVKQQGLEVKDAHDALGDCLMTLGLIRAVFSV